MTENGNELYFLNIKKKRNTVSKGDGFRFGGPKRPYLKLNS